MTGKRYSDERKKQHSISMLKAVQEHPLSYSANNVCGRTKIVEYNGKKLNGKWELIVAKWLDKQNIIWTNEIDGIEYEWSGSTHLYFPDFYLKELDKYIEVKGYERDRDLYKWESVDNLIKIKKYEIELIKKGDVTIVNFI